MKKNKRIWTLFLLPIAITPLASIKIQAASFDCDKATAKVEKMICSDLELSSLNEEIDKLFKAQQEHPYAEALSQSQIEWLKRRNRCEDISCVKQSAVERKNALTAFSKYSAIKRGGAQAEERKNGGAAQSSAVNPTPKKPKEKKYAYKILRKTSRENPEVYTGWEVCEDLETSLNHVRPSRVSFNSEIKFDPQMQQFSLPVWVELNIEEHWQELYIIENYLEHRRFLPGRDDSSSPPSEIPPFDEWLEGYQRALNAGYLAKLSEHGELLRRPLHPQLRMTQVRFEKDGPLRTVIGYARERNNFQCQMEWEESRERCPFNAEGERVCLNPQDEGLGKLHDAKWGNVFDEPGEHIFFYDSANGRWRDIRMGVWASDMTANLILHKERAYLIAMYQNEWIVQRIEAFDNPISRQSNAIISELTCRIKIK